MTHVAKLALLVAVLAAPLALRAEAGGGAGVMSAWARATPGATTVGAAYGEIAGDPKADDTLVSVSSPVAGRVEIHTHTEVDGVMKMRRLDALPIPAGELVKLAPGGHHIMLIDLKAPLKDGDTLPLTFTFKSGGTQEVTAKILPVGAPGPDAKAMGDAAGSDAGSHAGSHDGGAGSHAGDDKGSHDGKDRP